MSYWKRSLNSTQNAAPCHTLRLVQKKSHKIFIDFPSLRQLLLLPVSMRFRSISICFCAGASTLPIHRCLVAQGSPRPKVGSSMAERFVVWGCLGYAVCHCNSMDLHIVLPNKSNNLRTHGNPQKRHPKPKGSRSWAALQELLCFLVLAPHLPHCNHGRSHFQRGSIRNMQVAWGSSPTECGQLAAAGPPVSWPCDLGHWRACHHRRTLFCCLTCFTYPWPVRGFQMFQDEVLEVKLGLPLHWVDCHHFISFPHQHCHILELNSQL